MKKSFFLIIFFLASVFVQAEEVQKTQTLQEQNQTQTADKQEELRKEKLSEYLSKLEKLEQEISKEKVWMKSYSSYL
ncbi:hypothetical protein KJ988_00225, partial [bacterium]|nr:hypothetical protein [bacterium]